MNARSLSLPVRNPRKGIASSIAERIASQFALRLRVRHYTEIDGYLAPGEAAALYRLAARIPDGGTVVEIGSWKGKSTYCLARGLRSGKVVAIDPFDASGDAKSIAMYKEHQGHEPLRVQFSRNMWRLGVLDKIEVKQGYSRDFVDQIRQINLLFIDGDHSRDACKFDYLNYSPSILRGGYLAFHDYDASRTDLGPTWVVDNMVTDTGQYRFIGLFGSLWVGQRS